MCLGVCVCCVGLKSVCSMWMSLWCLYMYVEWLSECEMLSCQQILTIHISMYKRMKPIASI